MERLWAPWRLEYIVAQRVEGCIFCVFPEQDADEKNHILCRGKHTYVIMNAFPYSNGHLLIPTYRHIADLNDMTDDESLEMMRLAQMSCRVLKELSGPDGFNIGLNLGTSAGAGIADHLHMHIVPRWNGDTNFMPVLADTKVIPEALETTYKKLKEQFDRLAQDNGS
ncbi:MAG: HIT domain-containing protein [Armatimonadetes bacterium]|nr:HIT domain-containing protein [Armatimonadota bacterium]